ncbi:MAG: glycosyltransferase family 4 protein [Bryobacteraceae bacterium]
MRILHLDSGREMRGGQWQALRLVEGLLRCGHTASLMCRRGSPLFDAAQARGLDARPLTIAAVRSGSGGVDLVHAHDARSHTIAALCSRAPFVVSRRVAFPPDRGVASRWKYTRARHYLAVSEFVRNVLIEAGVPATQISVVYDGVPLLPLSAQTGGFIAPATADPRKGSDLASEAARLAGVDLRFSDNLERDLRDAACLLYLTHAEGLGSAVLLAMSAGVPVIASRLGGLTEIIDHGRTGILTPNDSGQIALHIRCVRDALAACQEFSREARAAIEARFTIERMVSGTLAVYKRVLS